MKQKINNHIKVGLIGCGAISKKHAAAIAAIKTMSLVGAFDLSKQNGQKFAKEHNVPFFTEASTMIKATKPDILVIATPSGMHAQNLLELLPYNKHFIVEKPLALRLDDIDNILEQCDQKGLKIFVVKQNRFNPPIQKLKDAITSGRFGKLVLGSVRVRWCRTQEYYEQKKWRGTWEFDGGVLTNQASHHIDTLLWMMGEPVSVQAKTTTRLASIEAEDTAAAIIKFKNGALGIIEATTATRPKDLEGSISILGEKGAVEVAGFFMNKLKTWQFAKSQPEDQDIWLKHASVPNEFAWNHTEFYKNVSTSLTSGSKGLIDGLEGRKSLELISALYESAETGKEVFLRYQPKYCQLGLNNHQMQPRSLASQPITQQVPAIVQ